MSRNGPYPPRAVSDVIRVLQRLAIKNRTTTQAEVASALGDFFTPTGEIAPDILASSLSDATPTAEVFGSVGGPGTGTLGSRDDHDHPMPDDPVPAHEADPDPHGQYTTDAEAGVIADDAIDAHKLESDPHPVYTTGAEATAAALAALAALFTGKGDILAGTGAGTYTRLTAPASTGYFLVSDPTAPTGMRWIPRTAEMATAVLAGADSVLVGTDRVTLE